MRWSDIKVTPGTRASERLPMALEDGRFLVHDGDLASAFCAAGKRLGAGALGSGNEPWRTLFHQEPAFLYAELASFRVEDAAFAFEHAVDEAPNEALREVAAIAKRLHHWLGRIRSNAPDQFSKQLKQLNAEVQLEAAVEALVRFEPHNLMKGIETSRFAKKQLARANGGLQEARTLKAALETTHRTLRNAIAALQPQARAEFETRIASKKMDPALGLLLAELRTAGTVEDRINRLVSRHTRFYYDEIIGQTPRPAGRETVLLDLATAANPPFLPAGSRLEARLPDNSVQGFTTDAGVALSAATVSDVAAISYRTDPDISFNAAFNAITDIEAARIGDIKPPPKNAPTKVFAAGEPVPVEMGLDLSSTMLRLSEGERKIRVRLNLRRVSDLPATSRPYRDGELRPEQGDLNPELLLALRSDNELLAAFRPGPLDIAVKEIAGEATSLADARGVTMSLNLVYEVLARGKMPSVSALRLLLSRLAAMCLIENVPFPSGTYWRDLFAHIAAHRDALTGLDRNPKSAMGRENYQDSSIFRAFSALPDGTIDNAPSDVFQKLLGAAFDVALSTEQGMQRPKIVHVSPNESGAGAGLSIQMQIDESMPAITGLAPDESPTMTLRLSEAAVVCPMSFVERYKLHSVDIDVEVTRLKKLVAFSDDGLVATDHTFLPFGIRPDDGATFVVGSPEMAEKTITAVGIDLNWNDLPDAPDGLSAHYESYGKNLPVPAPQLTVDYLSGDGWKPVSGLPIDMVDSDPVTGRLLDGWSFRGDVQGHTEPAYGVVRPKEFASRQTIRAGMVRLTLSGTAGAFHADRYPLALVDAMRPSWNPLKQRAIPPKPFVPKVAQLSLSYTATHRIDIEAPDSAKIGDRLVQVNPFGRVEVFPKRMMRDIGLMPQRLGFGEIFIQLAGPNVTGPLVLSFEMAQSGHLRVVPRANPVKWFYLSPLGWQALPDTALSSDTTAGLMRSGLVMVDLPEDAVQHSPEMPAGGAWIAAATSSQRLDDFPALKQVKVNGVWATCSDGTYHASAEPRVWTFNPQRPGISVLREITTPAGIRPPETERAYVTRVGERLKHRSRAVTPWDVERLVLEAFPEVWMAKCLPHLTRESPRPAPGQASLVVVRRPARGPAEATPAPSLFDVATLKRIESHLAKRASELGSIDVVNPTFERLQVRAKLEFDPTREDGATAQQLKLELARFLSVWTADDELGRFGWSLNMRSLMAHVSAQPYVRSVTDFSVLHLAGDDRQTYRLADTARGTDAVLRSRWPWGLPLSTPDHILAVQHDQEEETAQPSGIGRLGVGDMLVVGGGMLP